MSISFYDASVESYKQIVGAVGDVLEKGRLFAEEKGINPDELLETRLIDDMLPLTFQLNSVRHHSLGAIQGMQKGLFQPPPALPEMDYRGYQQFIADTQKALEELDVDEVNELEGKPLIFRLSDREIPFVTNNFVLTFSLPNLNFHATTAYDLLRKEGVPLSKLNYLGKMRVG